MEPGTQNWWESEAELFHPTAPLTDDRLYLEPMALHAPLAVRESRAQLTLTAELPMDAIGFEVEIHAGRMILISEGQGRSRFARAMTLPENLDYARASVRFHRGQVEVTYPFHPEAAWHRRWRLFKRWFAALLSRLFG